MRRASPMFHSRSPPGNDRWPPNAELGIGPSVRGSTGSNIYKPLRSPKGLTVEMPASQVDLPRFAMQAGVHQSQQAASNGTAVCGQVHCGEPDLVSLYCGSLVDVPVH